MRPPLHAPLALGLVAVALATAACGGGSSLDLSPQGASGRKIAATNGCSSCHGSSGEGGVGPPFVGLSGSDREFTDAPPTIADEAYLSESIKDPRAKRVLGYSARMPDNSLDDDEIADVIAYIRELQDVAP